MKEGARSCFVPVMAFICGVVVGHRGFDQQVVSAIQSKNEESSIVTEKEMITLSDVTSRIWAIEELTVYYGSYEVERVQDQSKYLMGDFKIPGTTNSISITCQGVVKVGYDLNDIVVKVDNSSEKIYIDVPDATVTDNYIIWDTVEVNEKNSILNQIEFAQYKELISDIEAAGLKDVENKDVYAKAENHLKRVLELSLEPLGYEIVYMDNENER